MTERRDKTFIFFVLYLKVENLNRSNIDFRFLRILHSFVLGNEKRERKGFFCFHEISFTLFSFLFFSLQSKNSTPAVHVTLFVPKILVESHFLINKSCSVIICCRRCFCDVQKG